MHAKHCLQMGLLFLAAALLAGAVRHGLDLGRFDANGLVLAALAIGGAAGYALGRGAAALP